MASEVRSFQPCLLLMKDRSVTSSNVLRTGTLQTKLNAGLSEQEQEDLQQKHNILSCTVLLTLAVTPS